MIPICLPCVSLLVVLPKPEQSRKCRCVVCGCTLFEVGGPSR